MATYNKDFRVKHGLIVDEGATINNNLQIGGNINGINVNSHLAYTQAAFDKANTGGGGGSVGLYVTNDTFTANGETNSFTLSVTPINEESTIINFDGVTQQKSQYTLSGDTVTFSNNPDNGTLIEVTSFVNAGNGIFITTEGDVVDNYARASANSASFYANTGISDAASASAYAQSALYNAASASLYANSGITLAQAAYNQGNSTAQVANTGINNAASASLYANTGINNAASASLYANAGITLAQTSYDQGNSTATVANTAVNNAASASLYANAGITLAQASYNSGNSTAIVANNKTQTYRQDTAPTSPSVGDIWIDSANALQYIYTSDTSSNQWVEWGPIGSPLGVTANLQFSGNTMFSTFANSTLTIQQTGTGNIQLNSSNTVTTSNLIVGRGLTVNNPTFTSTESAVRIVGSSNGREQLPVNSGYMLHVTGQDNTSSRIINDSFGAGAYPLLAGRAARGNVANPEAIQSGDVITRWSGNAHDGTSYAQFGTGRIDMVATENHTPSSKGTRIEFWTMERTTNTFVNIATFNGANVTFTGQVNAQKGFSCTTKNVTSNSYVIDFVADGVIRMDINAAASISFTNYIPGKQIDVWVKNTSGSTRTVTHGCLSENATNNNTTKSMPSTSTMLLRYTCFGVDSANVCVAVIQG